VLDKLPFLIARSPELPSTLQRFVDHDARQVAQDRGEHRDGLGRLGRDPGDEGDREARERSHDRHPELHPGGPRLLLKLGDPAEDVRGLLPCATSGADDPVPAVADLARAVRGILRRRPARALDRR